MRVPNKKGIDKRKAVNLLNLIFGLDIVLVGITAYFGGFESFQQLNKENVILICIGMLTFVSVFFSFVYGKAVEWRQTFFEAVINPVEQDLKNEVKERVEKVYEKSD